MLKTNYLSKHSNASFGTHLYSTGTCKITCDYEQGDFILRAHMETKSNAAKKIGRQFEKNKGKWTKKAENRTREKFLAVGEARVAIF